MLRVTILTSIMISMPAAAQTVIDDSASRMSPDELRTVTETVTDHLRDPGSAQFRRLRPRGENALRVWCGEVNAKTHQGGYAGFVTFIVSMERRNVLFGNGSAGQFAPTSAVLAVGAECKQ